MANCKPNLVAAAMKMLPPLPDASILLAGEERYEEMEVYKDLLAYGHVVGPEEEKEDAAGKVVPEEEAAAAAGKVGPEAAAGKKGRWELAWRSAPLIVHDAGVVRAIDALAPDLADVSASVCAAAICGVLEEHPGPVGCLRLDFLDCPSPGLPGNLMDLIGSKEVRELVVVNKKRPAKEEFFELQLLPGGLRSLSLGCFSLSTLDLDTERFSPSLAELRLTGCDLCGQALSALLPDLRALRLLVLGCCHVTSGCGPGGLRIVSCSLVRFDMSLCTASGNIRLEYAPRLASLTTGVRPLDNKGGRLRVDMRTPCALRELHGLKLPVHDFTFISPFTTWSQQRKIPTLPNLSILGIRLGMSNQQHTAELIDLLRYLPCLTDLTLTREDNVHPEEALQCDQNTFILPCIASSMRVLVMRNFRGGAAEVAFATNVLAVACHLASLFLRPHPMLPPATATEATTCLLACPRASPACQVHLAGF